MGINKIIKWWKNVLACRPFKMDLHQEIKKRNKWMELYITTLPKHKEILALRLKNIRKGF